MTVFAVLPMQLFWGVNRIISMGRRPRVHFNGAVYHVMARGVDGRDIFTDDLDRRAFLSALFRICGESGAEVLAYCLMGNHFHLAIQVGSIGLMVIMQRLLTGYSTAYNSRHGRTGHLFQARYRAILCVDDAYLAVLMRYIHQNPVRAGMVVSAADWPWSSFRQCEEADTPIPSEFDPWKAPKDPPRLLRFIEGPQLAIEEIAIKIQARTGITLKVMRSPVRRRDVVAARRSLTAAAIGHGHSLHSIAVWLQTSPTSISRYSKSNTVTSVRPDT